jgi:lipoate-protein ligase A
MDFDYRTMANVAKIPDEKWRDKVFQTIEENVTTMKRELGTLPDRYDVQRVLIEEFEKVLGPLERVAMPASVVKRAQVLGKQMLDPSFLLGKRKSRVDSFKVNSNTHLLFGSHKAKGGLIRSVARVEGPDLGGLIQDVSLSGDFTLVPKESIRNRLEPAIRGAIRREQEIRPKVEEFFDGSDLEMPGVEAKDVVKALGLDSES